VIWLPNDVGAGTAFSLTRASSRLAWSKKTYALPCGGGVSAKPRCGRSCTSVY